MFAYIYLRYETTSSGQKGDSTSPIAKDIW